MNTLLLYILLLALTDRKTDRETNTLASRGLEEPAHALRGLEEPFFSVVLLCQFLVLAGNRILLFILLCTWSTIQLWCCVSFFVVCLVGARSLLRPEKKIHSSVWRVHDYVCLSCRDRYICISSTWIKTNTNPLVQIQYIRYIWSIHTIHVIQIIPQ